MSNENFKNVSSKYNKTEGRTEETKIQELRDFNNWIKMSLINLFCPVNSNILDICGGRGGDIRKYRFKKVNNYVLFDNADLLIKEANIRIGKLDEKTKAKEQRKRQWLRLKLRISAAAQRLGRAFL